MKGGKTPPPPVPFYAVHCGQGVKETMISGKMSEQNRTIVEKRIFRKEHWDLAFQCGFVVQAAGKSELFTVKKQQGRAYRIMAVITRTHVYPTFMVIHASFSFMYDIRGGNLSHSLFPNERTKGRMMETIRQSPCEVGGGMCVTRSLLL